MNKNEVLFAKTNDLAIIPSKRVEDGGYDIYTTERKTLILPQNEIYMFPTGLISAFSNDYVIALRERGSSGTKGLSVRAGIIDSGYRNEWLVPINNTSRLITVFYDDTKFTLEEVQKDFDCLEFYIFYPYSKAICQALLVPVPKVDIKEVSIDEVKNIESERGLGKLGSSGK